MNSKFQQAIDESIRATETHSQALLDIHAIVGELDEALAQKTRGVVHAKLVEDDEFEPAAWVALDALKIEIHAKDGYSEVLCHVVPDDSGYPVAVYFGLQVKTLCADRDSLEWKIADLLREPQFGHRLKMMMGDGAGTPLPSSPPNK